MGYIRSLSEYFSSRRFQKVGLLLSLIAVLGGAQSSNAQNESGQRSISKPAYEQDWYNSEVHKYHLYAPIITTLPPLNSGMPYNILSAYLHLDSLGRFNTNWGLLQASSAWRVERELLKKALASYYQVVDYDPLRFQQYERETALKKPLYRSIVGGLTRHLPDALVEAASEPSERMALASTIIPDYVLRIRVLAIDSTPTNLALNSPAGAYIFNVMAQVLDTLKGQIFQPCQDQGAFSSSPAPIEPTPSCLYMQYYPGSYFQREEWNFVEDSAFADGNKRFRMQVGQEAVVFLSFINQKFDSTHDAFELVVDPTASYNALPIINGQIRDINRIWSSEIMKSYSDWRRRFIEVRNKILNGTY